MSQYSPFSNLIVFYTYLQSDSQFFFQLKSTFWLDEQGGEGKRQENNPSDDCNYGSKIRKSIQF